MANLVNEKESIFISYPWDSKDGQKFALWLYTFLTEKYNANVYFDRATAHPGTNLKEFMSKATKSKYVICICNDYYVERMSMEKSGVKFEVDNLRKNNVNNIIPLVDQDKMLPYPFDNLKYVKVNMSDPTNPKNVEAYYEILNYIFPDKSNHVSTKYDQQVKRLRKITKIKHSISFNPNSEGELSLNIKTNDGKTEVGRNKQKFILKWSECNINTAYIYSDFIDSFLFISKQRNVFDSTRMPNDLEKNFNSYKRVNSIGVGYCFAFINSFDFILVGQILSIHNGDIRFKYKILQQ